MSAAAVGQLLLLYYCWLMIMATVCLCLRERERGHPRYILCYDVCSVCSTATDRFARTLVDVAVYYCLRMFCMHAMAWPVHDTAIVCVCMLAHTDDYACC